MATSAPLPHRGLRHGCSRPKGLAPMLTQPGVGWDWRDVGPVFLEDQKLVLLRTLLRGTVFELE